MEKSTSTTELIEICHKKIVPLSIKGLAFDGKVNENKTELKLWDIGGGSVYLRDTLDLNQTEALTLLEALKQLKQFLEEDQETDGHLFTKLVFVRHDYDPPIKLKLKCSRYLSDGKVVAFLQVDYWNDVLNRWIYGKKNPTLSQIHVVRLIDSDFIELTNFIKQHFQT